MQLEITGRQIEVTPALRAFAEEKLKKLERLLDGPIEIHAVLGIEKHRHTAEIQVKSRTAVLSGTQETGDLYASIREVADKLERQALKHKEKMHHRKPRRSPRDPQVAATIGANAGPEEEATEPPRRPRIVRSQRYSVKPLTVEDAVLELEETNAELLVFREAESGRVAVVHRQKDGNIGLVEPDY
jgi:putative sigma-54 modulation protein